MNNFFRKLQALLWKNFKLKLRTPCKTICEIVAPAICVIVVMLLVLGIVLIADKPLKVKSGDTKFKSEVLKWNIHYVKSSKYVTNIMKEMKNTLGNYTEKKINFYEHSDEGSLQTAMETGECIFAIIFEKGNILKETDRELKITVRSCLRFQLMSELYKISVLDNEYLQNKEGFLDIQFALIDAILKAAKDPKPEYDIEFQRFPIRKLKITLLQIIGEYLVLVLVMLSFCFHCYIVTATIGKEKESELKESMKGFGISVGIQWFSWFVTFFASFLMVIILILLTCKVVKPNNSLLPNSDGFLLFIFLILAVCVIMAMCLMFSTFFNKAFFGALTCLLIWLASFFLYLALILMKYPQLETYVKLMSCIVPYWGIVIGFKLFFNFDKAGFGMQWKYLFRQLDGTDGVTLGYVMLILLFDFFLFLLIAIYLDAVRPGKSGMPKKWNYLCQRSYWTSDYEKMPETETNEDTGDPENFEDEPENVPIGINIKHLSKKFGSHEAVKDLNLRVYDGQITVLLGHNGAGKTTTMSMVTGLMKPSKGTVIVGENDILRNVEKIRLQTGLCPQHNILFASLTVEDHLYFYCKIKGLKGEHLKAEVNNYLQHLHLEHVKNTKAKLLSGGEQRKLSVGLAFCGGTKYIVLDEPTSGMDPRARRQLWTLLEQEKQGRTILLSTHFMDEADTLGDRIAIMDHGIVECCGSPFFLKKKYGAGYKLTIVKQPGCETDAVTRALQSRIPGVKLTLDRRAELNYLLRNEDSGLFEHLLSDLEQRQNALKVESFGLSVTTLEEVFLRVGAPPASGDDNAVKDKEFEMVHLELKKGSVVWFYQIFAMFLKRTLYASRSWVTLIIILIVPSIAFLMLFQEKADMKNSQQLTLSQDAILLDLNLYKSIKIPIEEKSGSTENDRLSEIYKHITKGFVVEDIRSHMNKVIKEDPVDSRASYIYGATFKDSNKIIAWYSLEALHSVTLSLLMVQNAILKKHVGKTVTLVNHPLPLTVNTEMKLENISISDATQFLNILGLAFAMYIIFYVRERSLRAKHLQFTSGVSVGMYWVFNYTWDMIFYLLSLSPGICVVYLQKENDPHVNNLAGALVVACILYGFCVLPLIYLCSFFTKSFPGTFCIVFFTNYLLLSVYTLFFTYDKINKPVIHRWAFILLPMCSMTEYIISIGEHWTFGSWDTLYSFDEDGVAHRIVFFVLEGIILFLLLLMIDYDAVQKLLYGMSKGNIPDRVHPTDPDVIETVKFIHEKNVKELAKNYDLVIKDLSKRYDPRKYAVNQINFAVERGECFGLLGTNGAGKTTIFKMILGNVSIGEGDIYLHGYSVKNVRRQTFNYVGYCPQFEALLPELTVRETLYMYALIRGIPLKHIKNTIYELANTMLFTEHLDKKIENLSGGTKRKVSACVAIMANPPLILLDEPTTGIDPDAKRRMWDLISAVRESGSCIVLSSHSMDECEALCTRLTILIRGNMMCIGSIQHLKNTFSKEYSLMIKGKVQPVPPPVLQPNMPPPPPPDPCRMDLITKFVFDTFPESYIMEEHHCFINFGIKTDVPVSKMFGIMEKARNTIVFEDYLLGQCTLEQVFMKLTKMTEE